jgi:hypothetical protein
MSTRPRTGIGVPFGQTDVVTRAPWPGTLSRLIGWHSGWSRKPGPIRFTRSSGSSGRPRSGWHAYRPMVGAPIPAWVVELALSIERPLDRSIDGFSEPRALLLARAAAWSQPLADALSDAARRVDRIAGTSPPLPSLRLVPPQGTTGFEAVAPSEVMAHLRLANERGRTTGGRRTRTERARVACWDPGAGAVLTCRSQVGVSAQAVIAVHGDGDPDSLRPPPGGATILRAWRHAARRRPATTDASRQGDRQQSGVPSDARREAEWALVAGVVVASGASDGLGRAARRRAAQVGATGWNVTVPTGSTALALARTGEPRFPPPASLAQLVSSDTVMAMLTCCLAASARPVDYPALPRP